MIKNKEKEYLAPVVAFDSIAPSSGEISISLYGHATGSASECDLNFIYISKVVYSQN